MRKAGTVFCLEVVLTERDGRGKAAPWVIWLERSYWSRSSEERDEFRRTGWENKFGG